MLDWNLGIINMNTLLCLLFACFNLETGWHLYCSLQYSGGSKLHSYDNKFNVLWLVMQGKMNETLKDTLNPEQLQQYAILGRADDFEEELQEVYRTPSSKSKWKELFFFINFLFIISFSTFKKWKLLSNIIPIRRHC